MKQNSTEISVTSIVFKFQWSQNNIKIKMQLMVHVFQKQKIQNLSSDNNTCKCQNREIDQGTR